MQLRHSHLTNKNNAFHFIFHVYTTHKQIKRNALLALKHLKVEIPTSTAFGLCSIIFALFNTTYDVNVLSPPTGLIDIRMSVFVLGYIDPRVTGTQTGD